MRDQFKKSEKLQSTKKIFTFTCYVAETMLLMANAAFFQEQQSVFCAKLWP